MNSNFGSQTSYKEQNNLTRDSLPSVNGHILLKLNEVRLIHTFACIFIRISLIVYKKFDLILSAQFSSSNLHISTMKCDFS